jgi:hypothetical protein
MTSVAVPHHSVAPPGKTFDAAPTALAPAPTHLYIKPTFFEQAKVDASVGTIFFLLIYSDLICYKTEWEKK